jgi:hypothetical protein
MRDTTAAAATPGVHFQISGPAAACASAEPEEQQLDADLSRRLVQCCAPLVGTTLTSVSRSMRSPLRSSMDQSHSSCCTLRKSLP